METYELSRRTALTPEEIGKLRAIDGVAQILPASPHEAQTRARYTLTSNQPVEERLFPLCQELKLKALRTSPPKRVHTILGNCRVVEPIYTEA